MIILVTDINCSVGRPWTWRWWTDPNSVNVGSGLQAMIAIDLVMMLTYWHTDNLCIEKVSHYWLTLLVICMATYMPNFGLVR